MKTPRIKNAELVTTEDVSASCRVDVWQGEKGFYIYFRDLIDGSLVLSQGPLKTRELVLEKAKGLAETLRHCR